MQAKSNMKLFLIGGFLGSGKTTAIHQAAVSALKNGEKVAVITNDQGSDLVDTSFIKHAGIKTEEVLNGCFCCNYDQFSDAIDSLRETEEPESIFAESVGSCTDLIATIAKPLGKFHPEISVVISIFADAALLSALINSNASFLNDHVRYIYKKQLEEADILIINKIDLLNDTELREVKDQIKLEYPGKKVLYQNSLDEDSIRNWVLLLNEFQLHANRKSLDLDYDLYAKGEAILAWVDQWITIGTKDVTAYSVALKFINTVYSKIRNAKYPIAHLKFLLDDGIQQRKISYTTLNNISKEIVLPDNRVNKISILLNARIQVDFSILEQLISSAILQISKETRSEVVVNKKAAFQPGYPRPTHRMA